MLSTIKLYEDIQITNEDLALCYALLLMQDFQRDEWKRRCELHAPEWVEKELFAEFRCILCMQSNAPVNPDSEIFQAALNNRGETRADVSRVLLFDAMQILASSPDAVMDRKHSAFASFCDHLKDVVGNECAGSFINGFEEGMAKKKARKLIPITEAIRNGQILDHPTLEEKGVELVDVKVVPDDAK
jgi:hypothetical protein